jgi:hypothetical protein
MRPCRCRPARGDLGLAGIGLHRPARPMAQPEWCWRLSRDANAGPGRDAGHRPSREMPCTGPDGLQERRPSRDTSCRPRPGKRRASPAGGETRRPSRDFSPASPAGTEDGPDPPRTGPCGALPAPAQAGLAAAPKY